MNRRLAAMHPSLTLTYQGGVNWAPTTSTPQTGWQQLGSNTGFFHETQIDLSGLMGVDVIKSRTYSEEVVDAAPGNMR